MKIACDHCEKVADETVAWGWFKVEVLATVRHFAEKGEGRYCSPACFAADFDPTPRPVSTQSM